MTILGHHTLAWKNKDYVAGSRVSHAKVKSSKGTTNAKIDLHFLFGTEHWNFQRYIAYPLLEIYVV